MPYTLNKAKILIVDDLKPMVTLSQSILNIFGFTEIFTASNADAAFELLCRNDPDLVITDWMMEPMDGLEFSRLIRRSPMSPNPYVPVLMMTGFSSKIRVEEARDAGITEFLVKPFASKDLYNRIVQIIEKPRQFVDVGNFFGPDRRRRDDSDYTGIRRRSDEKSSPEQKDMLKKLRENAKNI